ncbi:urease accessory protein UreF [Sinorhizobium numidicum]|uniref:Urease accessory protein UreF n=1 Tax=Sinorhizobium numidicum TaxID=680248 RepID=A0ABY8D2Z0_9HYPH|nr:urease accessory protein UreF [Sinorhizobium numidicum]WEX79226.1 urease accessory protein UreF [Sinorhizobium numidicum]WEX85246.1 urease accessory protein UreF [Sinorhizobium numidicum]
MTEHADTQALLRLVTWLSPAFPIGSFSYSGGLEQAVHDSLVTNADDLRLWLETLLSNGTAWNDSLLLAESYRGFEDAARLRAVRDLAEALAGSRERQMETMLLGEAFLAAAGHWPHPMFEVLGPNAAYPVAVGAVAGAHHTGLEPALAAYLNATMSNAVSVAIRCGVTGQRDGVGVLAHLEWLIADTAVRAARGSLDDLGSAAIMADIVSLRHENLHSRLFRS